MPPSESGKYSAARPPLKALVWFGLALTYLAASASGQRSMALAVVGLMVGVVIMASGWRWIGLLAGALLAAGGLAVPASVALLAYAPPLAAFAFMAWFFGRTLRPGSEPLINRVAKVEHPVLPDELARHAVLLTWIWALCFAGMFIVALALIPLLPLDAWSRWVQGLGYALPALLFLGEYVYRRVALGHYPHTPLPVMLRNVIAVMKAEAMTASRNGQSGPR